MRYKIHKQYRLPEYDYSQGGMYFITICTQNRIKYFGDVINEKMELNNIGITANKFWLEIPKHFQNIILDEYIIMPDHVHGIIFIDKDIPAKNECRECDEYDEHDEHRCDVDVGGGVGVDVGTGHCPVPVPVPINEKINEIFGIGQCRGTTLSGTTGTTRTGQCPVPTNTTNTNEYSTFGHVLPQSISTIIGSFKSICTKTINQKYPNLKFGWQTRFYDRIIRDETALNNIRNYIYNNPFKWELDRNNKQNLLY